MPGVDPRGMAPPLLGLEPAKIFLINSPVAIRLFLCDRARGAPAAPPGTPHANRGHCPQRRWPRRPCMPPALRARRLGEPRHHHDIIVGVLGSFPFPSQFPRDGRTNRGRGRAALPRGVEPSVSGPAGPSALHCAALAPAPLLAPDRFLRRRHVACGNLPGTPTAAGGAFSGQLGDSGPDLLRGGDVAPPTSLGTAVRLWTVTG